MHITCVTVDNVEPVIQIQTSHPVVPVMPPEPVSPPILPPEPIAEINQGPIIPPEGAYNLIYLSIF